MRRRLAWNPECHIRPADITHSNTVLYTYLNADENPRCLATRSKTNTSFPCSCRRNVFASTSRKIRLKCSLSTRNRWQLFSFSTIVAALKIEKGERVKIKKKGKSNRRTHTSQFRLKNVYTICSFVIKFNKIIVILLYWLCVHRPQTKQTMKLWCGLITGCYSFYNRITRKVTFIKWVIVFGAILRNYIVYGILPLDEVKWKSWFVKCELWAKCRWKSVRRKSYPLASTARSMESAELMFPVEPISIRSDSP